MHQSSAGPHGYWICQKEALVQTVTTDTSRAGCTSSSISSQDRPGSDTGTKEPAALGWDPGTASANAAVTRSRQTAGRGVAQGRAHLSFIVVTHLSTGSRGSPTPRSTAGGWPRDRGAASLIRSCPQGLLQRKQTRGSFPERGMPPLRPPWDLTEGAPRPSRK